MTETSRTYELDLGANGHFTFSSVEEMQSWISDDLKAWEWVGQHQQPTMGLYNQAMKQFRRSIQAGIPATASWDDLISPFRNAYKPLVHHASRRGQYVMGLQDQGHEVAAAALATMVGAEVSNPTGPRVLRGSLLGLVADTAHQLVVEAAVTRFDSLNNEIQRWLSEKQTAVQHELTEAAKSRTALSQFQTETTAKLQALESSTTATVTKDTAKAATTLPEADDSTQAAADLAGGVRRCKGWAAARARS